MALTLDSTQYDLARNRAAQQNNQAVQGQKDALKRRFAALGSINSGAAIKQDQLAEESGQQNLTNANQNIDASQAQEKQRIAEVNQGQEFAKSERLGSQEFAGGQAELGRKFQTSERLGGQDYASMQADLQRKFQTGERLSSQDFANLQRLGSQEFSHGENEANRFLQNQQYTQDLQFRQKVSDQQNEQFDKQYGLATKQFIADQATTDFNKRLAEQAANQKDNGIFSQIGSGYHGILNTGKSYYDSSGAGGYIKNAMPSY